MTQFIHKQRLKLVPHQIVDFPVGVDILYAREQNSEDICVWYRYHTKYKFTEPHQVYIVGTGHEMPEVADTQPLKHIGSAHLKGGMLIFHVFVGMRGDVR